MRDAKFDDIIVSCACISPEDSGPDEGSTEDVQQGALRGAHTHGQNPHQNMDYDSPVGRMIHFGLKYCDQLFPVIL